MIKVPGGKGNIIILHNYLANKEKIIKLLLLGADYASYEGRDKDSEAFLKLADCIDNDMTADHVEMPGVTEILYDEYKNKLQEEDLNDC